jgi:putative PIN family toxin of toxin-antitoxin system
MPAQIFLLAANRLIQMYVTDTVFAEYDEVIRRPRLKRDFDEIEGALRTIREQAQWVKTTEVVNACFDPDDNIFLECAQAAGADYLVTGNVDDFPEVWKATRIVTAREFLGVIAETRPDDLP